MITFSVEDYSEDTVREILPLLENHYQEIALNKDQIKLEPDWDVYKTLGEKNMLHIVFAKDGEELVGYYVGVIRPHLHYKSSLTAYNDVYFINPKARNVHMIAIRLFKFIEETLKKRGVQRMTMNTKFHKNVGLLFERLNYEQSDIVYTKMIGD
jgi:hypothetical protein